MADMIPIITNTGPHINISQSAAIKFITAPAENCERAAGDKRNACLNQNVCEGQEKEK
jgi:hypothetical protein